MNEKTRIDDWLERAFRLAYFIHGDVEVAKQIAFSAMNKLEVASNAQYKRNYYTPIVRTSRCKVSMNDLQLLQRLVYVESENFEKEKEFTEQIGEKDALVYFIKHLIRLTLKRNSFYVTLGLSRILHNYGTAETMEIYNAVVQNPERVHDDYYYRSRKGVLLKELKNRFGNLLEISTGNRGEQRFRTKENSADFAELVEKCLREFTPWKSSCVLPQKFDPTTEIIDALCFEGKNPDDEHRIEINRMHTVLHPECFKILIDSLGFDAPQEKLEIPEFNMKNNNRTAGKFDRRDKLTSLEDEDLQQIKEMLAREAAWRKSASCGVLRVVVDGEEQVLFDTLAKDFVRFNLPEDAPELLEIYANENGKDFLLATYLMSELDDCPQNAITLEGGQKVTFNFLQNSDETVCKISYAETHFRRQLNRIWQKTAICGFTETAILKPVCASLILFLAVAMGFGFYLNLFGESPQIAQNNEYLESLITENIVAVKPVDRSAEVKSETSLTPKNQITPVKNRIEKAKTDKVATKLDKENIKPKNQIKIIEPKKNIPNPAEIAQVENPKQPIEIVEKEDVIKFPVLEKDYKSRNTNTTRAVLETGKNLKDIKYLYIEVTGDEKLGHRIREKLADKINAEKRFIAVNNKDQADGLLKVFVRSEDGGETETMLISAIVRVVNANGFVVSPNRYRVSAWKYVGRETDLTVKISKDLTNQK